MLLPLVLAAILPITSTHDSGPGSLRAALESARDGDRVEFRFAEPVPANGWFTIQLESLLPQIKAGIAIDGTTQTAATGDTNPFGPEVEIDGSEAEHGPGLKFVAASRIEVSGLAIGGFSGNGIVVERGNLAKIVGNYVGVDPTGTAARANGLNGVLFIGATGATLGGNVISGNAGNGVYVVNSNVWISGNHIGAGRSTSFPVPNGANGIDVATYVSEIDSNVITYNRDNGITLAQNAGMVAMTRNEIWGNGDLSIDLGHDGVDVDDALDVDRGANGKMNAPVLKSARTGSFLTIRGEIHTVPNHEVILNFYAAPHRSELGLGEAQVWLGYRRIATNAGGFAEFEFESRDYRGPFLPGGYVVATAFAAGAREGTSELSVPIALEATSRTFEVNNLRDAGPGSLRAAIESANATECTSEAPCRITFHVPDGGSVIELASPLPPIARDSIYLEGGTQAYWNRNVGEARKIEIRGNRAGDDGVGLRVGSAEQPVSNVAVRDLVLRGFAREGLVLHQRRERWLGSVAIDRVEVIGNGRDGMVMFGGSGAEGWNQGGALTLSGTSIVANDNGGHGIVMDGDANHLIGVTAMRNAGDGVFVRGSNCRVETATLAFNGGAGGSSAAEARAVYFEGNAYGNGSLGIDRLNDGPTPNDETEADGILDAPVITSARWDAALAKTIIRGRVTPQFPKLPERQAWSHRADTLRFFANDRLLALPYDVFFQQKGDTFELQVKADLRGQRMTARRLLSLCFWEFGCGAADSSEYSGAVRVE